MWGAVAVINADLSPPLVGFVDARYAGALRWIGWLGFSFEPYGEVNGAPFLRFVWEE
jgi:hypothetical protein